MSAVDVGMVWRLGAENKLISCFDFCEPEKVVLGMPCWISFLAKSIIPTLLKVDLEDVVTHFAAALTNLEDCSRRQTLDCGVWGVSTLR